MSSCTRNGLRFGLVVWLVFAAGAEAGGTAGLPGQATSVGEARTRVRARIAVIPDTQNYCSSSPIGAGTPNAAELAIGPAQLDILVNDVIAWGPDFVVQVGDVGDQAGSDSDDRTDADNFTTDAAKYAESTCAKTHLFDRLDGAGIPWLISPGNHDSYRDFERVFTRAAFLATSYDYSAQNEMDRFHAGFNDTEERAALMPSPIGTICVVSADYVLDPAGGTLDDTYAQGAIGCGASRPTIGVRHYGALPGMSVAGNSEVFMRVNGHSTPTQPGQMQTFSVYSTAGGFEILDLFTNSQEQSLSCGSTDSARTGADVHTGVTWWTMVEIVPAENAIFIQARGPLYGAVSQDWACGNTYQNGVATFAPSFCTRFPGGPGC